MMNSKMMASGGAAMPMKMKDGKKVPAFLKKGGATGMHKMPDGKMMKDSDMAKMKTKMAAGGGMMKAKMAAGGGMMKTKMAAGGGMMKSKMGMSGGASKGGVGEEVMVRGSGAARSRKAKIY